MAMGSMGSSVSSSALLGGRKSSSSSSSDPMSFGGITLTPGNSVGTGGRTTTTYASDPQGAALLKMLMGMAGKANIPGFTMDALKRITQDPSGYLDTGFDKIAAPLLNSLIPTEKSEQQSLNDIFRLSGADQSGAYAAGARSLIGDQANRRQTLLASNYVPLTKNVSDTALGAIKSGLMVPDALSGPMKAIAGAAGSFGGMKPVSTESVGVSPGPTVMQQPTGTSASPSLWQWLNGDPFASSNNEIAQANQRWDSMWQ